VVRKPKAVDVISLGLASSCFNNCYTGLAFYLHVLLPLLPLLLLLLLLVQVLRGERQSAQLMALNASDPEGWAPGHTGEE
jgi:hypothetical protein